MMTSIEKKSPVIRTKGTLTKISALLIFNVISIALLVGLIRLFEFGNKEQSLIFKKGAAQWEPLANGPRSVDIIRVAPSGLIWFWSKSDRYRVWHCGAMTCAATELPPNIFGQENDLEKQKYLNLLLVEEELWVYGDRQIYSLTDGKWLSRYETGSGSLGPCSAYGDTLWCIAGSNELVSFNGKNSEAWDLAKVIGKKAENGYFSLYAGGDSGIWLWFENSIYRFQNRKWHSASVEGLNDWTFLGPQGENLWFESQEKQTRWQRILTTGERLYTLHQISLADLKEKLTSNVVFSTQVKMVQGQETQLLSKEGVLGWNGQKWESIKMVPLLPTGFRAVVHLIETPDNTFIASVLSDYGVFNWLLDRRPLAFMIFLIVFLVPSFLYFRFIKRGRKTGIERWRAVLEECEINRTSCAVSSEDSTLENVVSGASHAMVMEGLKWVVICVIASLSPILGAVTLPLLLVAIFSGVFFLQKSNQSPFMQTLARRDFFSAEREIRKVLHSSSRRPHPDSIERLGMVLNYSGRAQESVDSMRVEILRSLSKSIVPATGVLCALADALLMRGQPEFAAKLFQEIVEGGSLVPRAYAGLAECRLVMNMNAEEALELSGLALKRAIRGNDTVWPVAVLRMRFYGIKAVALALLGRDTEAEQALSDAESKGDRDFLPEAAVLAHRREIVQKLRCEPGRTQCLSKGLELFPNPR